MFAPSVTSHVSVLVLVHPVHEEKLLLPAVAGAVKTYCVPEAAVSVNGVFTWATTLLLGLPTPMLTPLAGFVESTVSV